MPELFIEVTNERFVFENQIAEQFMFFFLQQTYAVFTAVTETSNELEKLLFGLTHTKQKGNKDARAGVVLAAAPQPGGRWRLCTTFRRDRSRYVSRACTGKGFESTEELRAPKEKRVLSGNRADRRLHTVTLEITGAVRATPADVRRLSFAARSE